jgi:hypothetical protein
LLRVAGFLQLGRHCKRADGLQCKYSNLPNKEKF